MFMISQVYKNKQVIIFIIIVLFLVLISFFLPLNNGLQFAGKSLGYTEDNRLFSDVPDNFSDKGSGSEIVSLQATEPKLSETAEYNVGTNSTNRMYEKGLAVTLTVSDIQSFNDHLSNFVASVGGFFFDRSLSYPEENYYGRASFRVPADKIGQVKSFFKGNSLKIVSEVEYSNDITDRYIDITQRLNRLTDTKERLIKLYESAKRTADIIEIHNQLQMIETEIESLVGNERYLKESANTLLVTVYFSSDESRLPYLPDAKFNPVLTFKKAVRLLLATVYKLFDLLIYLIVFSVFIIPSSIVFIFIYRFLQKKFFSKSRSLN